MSVGLLGEKLGMTQIFESEQGTAIPVTAIQAGPCTVTQIKTEASDGYNAIQLGYGETKPKALTRPESGHLQKSGAPPLRHLKEYRTAQAEGFELGQQLTAERFEAGQTVDVKGISIGRGFAGYQKRHNFSRGSKTHGSKNYRHPGAIGPGSTPGRVYPGSRMAGRMGGKPVTVRKLKIVRVDPERNLLLVKGAVPGKLGGVLSIAPSNIVGGVSADA
ncbi:MAG: 50S ribosomal protein L3 [Cyanobacteria bacterium QS_8_64_29]|nr:MAG: 50S ribosomal protein L3 [Cyanobacteria bacterium QS_8_64_29]